MIDIDLKQPRNALLYAAAMKIRTDLAAMSWYDAGFLRRYEAAKRFLKIANPGALDDFVAGFDPLRTDPGFKVVHLHDLFDAETFQTIRDTIAAMPTALLEHHERDGFGREVVHDHPYFSQLQASLTERMSQWVGQEVEPAYNFLSLYSGLGVCEPHMDEPMAKWTLDICVDQSVEWPIYFSQIVDWPTTEAAGRQSAEIIGDPELQFEAATLHPNNAIIFSGSSQWHYRDRIPGQQSAYCNLLFFHYFPKGYRHLVEPKQWARHFGLPELDILISTFELQTSSKLATA